MKTNRFSLIMPIVQLNPCIKATQAGGISKEVACHVVQSKYEKTHHKLQQKQKWAPSCRKFCVDVKNETFIKINRVAPVKNNNLYFFFTIMKNMSLITTNMVYICSHTQYKIMWMAGWLITKTIWRITHRNMQIQGKIFFISSYFMTVFSS